MTKFKVQRWALLVRPSVQWVLWQSRTSSLLSRSHWNMRYSLMWWRSVAHGGLLNSGRDFQYVSRAKIVLELYSLMVNIGMKVREKGGSGDAYPTWVRENCKSSMVVSQCKWWCTKCSWVGEEGCKYHLVLEPWFYETKLLYINGIWIQLQMLLFGWISQELAKNIHTNLINAHKMNIWFTYLKNY